MEVAKIKEKVETLKASVMKAQVGKENIEEQWKAQYGTIDPVEIEKIISKKQKELEALRTEYASVVKELEGLTDWDSV